jgi:hypothetical protein
MPTAFLAAFITTLLFVALQAHAGAAPPFDRWWMFDRDWNAGTRTAMGVTGDARLTPTSITFDHRVTFKLRYLSEVTAPKSTLRDEVRQFSLFEIVDPQPKTIVGGNHLCGHPDLTETVPLARYLAVGLKRDSSFDWLIVIPFSTPHPPADAVDGRGSCNPLGYIRDH